MSWDNDFWTGERREKQRERWNERVGGETGTFPRPYSAGPLERSGRVLDHGFLSGGYPVWGQEMPSFEHHSEHGMVEFAFVGEPYGASDEEVAELRERHGLIVDVLDEPGFWHESTTPLIITVGDARKALPWVWYHAQNIPTHYFRAIFPMYVDGAVDIGPYTFGGHRP